MKFSNTVATLALVLLSYSGEAIAIDYSLSVDEINKAIEYGNKNKKVGVNKFRTKWFRRVGTGINTVEFTIVSPFFNVALEARMAANQYQEYGIVEGSKHAGKYRDKFAVMVSFLNSKMTIPSDYFAVVKIGETVVKHVSIENLGCDPHSQGYLCQAIYIFNSDDVPSDAKVKVVFVKGGIGKESVASFDLKKVP